MISPRHVGLRSVVIAALFAGTGLVFAGGLFGQSVTPAKPAEQETRRTPARTELRARPAEAPRPFAAGEKLEYRVLWSQFSVKAATVRLSVIERRPFYGREAWHFQALARTIDTMRIVFPLDDQFDSYSEASSLASLQYEMYLSENGKQENASYRMTTDADPAPGSGAAVRVLPGTRDPIGFLYYVRTVDWSRTKEIRSAVFDGRKLYEVRARLQADRGQVSVPAGDFTASRIEVRVYERGQELAGTLFRVSVAHDAGRTPVLLEAEIPFGSARVELAHRE